MDRVERHGVDGESRLRDRQRGAGQTPSPRRFHKGSPAHDPGPDAELQVLERQHRPIPAEFGRHRAQRHAAGIQRRGALVAQGYPGAQGRQRGDLHPTAEPGCRRDDIVGRLERVNVDRDRIRGQARIDARRPASGRPRGRGGGMDLKHDSRLVGLQARVQGLGGERGHDRARPNVRQFQIGIDDRHRRTGQRSPGRIDAQAAGHATVVRQGQIQGLERDHRALEREIAGQGMHGQQSGIERAHMGIG
ncbi:MAG: hypothetical protein R3E48_17685 [Burkholderiaceae bacterium]